jgi:hypothetical protein
MNQLLKFNNFSLLTWCSIKVVISITRRWSDHRWSNDGWLVKGWCCALTLNLSVLFTYMFSLCYSLSLITRSGQVHLNKLVRVLWLVCLGCKIGLIRNLLPASLNTQIGASRSPRKICVNFGNQCLLRGCCWLV